MMAPAPHRQPSGEPAGGLTTTQIAIAVLAWRAGFDSLDIARSLKVPEAWIWNALTPLRRAA